ncbi:hypothetical protein ACJMK2_035462 [Sinanodonta woodiana]|uniref:PH domain-containing protein n=1 Tax=Sinanodonta woodiana TaxID=1069815 RepID=A0ABD3WV14_SINWO
MTEHVFEGVLEKTAGRSSCIGSIDLTEVQTVKPLPDKGGTRFEISTGTRSFTFVADSSEKCKEWVDQIHKAWADESTHGDDSGISHNLSKENKLEDLGPIGSTAVMKKNWEKMISNTAVSPIAQPSVENHEHEVQRRPSTKKEKSESHKLESESQNGSEKHYLSGPYDKPWSSYLSCIGGTDDPSSSSIEASSTEQRNDKPWSSYLSCIGGTDDPSSSSIEASSTEQRNDKPWSSYLSCIGGTDDPSSSSIEASSTEQRNDPKYEMSCVSVECSNNKVEEDELADKIEDGGSYSQKIISERIVPNSSSNQTQISFMPIESKEAPTEQKDFDKMEPDTAIVEMRRSRTIVKVHRDGSVSNVEDADRYSKEPGMRSKSRDVSKLQRQEALELQPEASADSRRTAESAKDLTSQYTIIDHKPEAIPVEALDQKLSADSPSDLVQEASEGKESALPTIEASTSASLIVNNGKPSLIELLKEEVVPLREITTFKPYALKQLKIFLKNNCDLVHLNLNVERCSTAKAGMEALKEFLNGI